MTTLSSLVVKTSLKHLQLTFFLHIHFAPSNSLFISNYQKVDTMFTMKFLCNANAIYFFEFLQYLTKMKLLLKTEFLTFVNLFSFIKNNAIEIFEVKK